MISAEGDVATLNTMFDDRGWRAGEDGDDGSFVLPFVPRAAQRRSHDWRV
ncbi:hypothetical protein [Streptomyces mayteni]